MIKVKYGKTLEADAHDIPVCFSNYSMCWCDDYCTKVEECIERQRRNNQRNTE